MAKPGQPQQPPVRPALPSGPETRSITAAAAPAPTDGQPAQSPQQQNNRPAPRQSAGSQTVGMLLAPDNSRRVSDGTDREAVRPETQPQRPNPPARERQTVQSLLPPPRPQGGTPGAFPATLPPVQKTAPPPMMDVQPQRAPQDIMQGYETPKAAYPVRTPSVQPMQPYPASPAISQPPRQAVPRTPQTPLRQPVPPQNRADGQPYGVASGMKPQQSGPAGQQRPYPEPQPQPSHPAQLRQPVPPNRPGDPVLNGPLPGQPSRSGPARQAMPAQQRPEEATSGKKKPRQKKKKRKKILTAVCIIMAILIGVAGGGMVYFGNMYSRMGTGMEMEDEEFTGLDGTVSFDINSDDLAAAGIGEVSTTTNLRSDPMIQNILLLGSDKRESVRSSDSGWNADTIIILSIDKRHKTLKMTSILRDSYVSIPGHGDNRINASYSYGGPNLIMKTIESNFGIKIDRYAVVSFRIFSEIVDLIGGVDLEITAAEAREINSRAQVEPGVAAGMVHLNGWQTLEYARIRKIDDDFARTSRQRKVLELILEKMKSASLTEIHNVLYEALPLVGTNLSQGEVLALIGEVSTILQYPVESTSIPASNAWQNKTIRGMQVLVLDMEANRNVIRQFIFESGISKFYGNTYSGYTYGYGYYSTRTREDSADDTEGQETNDETGEGTPEAATS